MKFYIAAITLLLTFVNNCFAQTENERADSVLFYKQGVIETEFASASATQIIFSPFKKIGSASLLGNYTRGHYRLPQQAEYDGQAKFSTFGISKIGRFNLSGFFNYGRTWQDSLAWTTKGLEVDAQPYYFASKKSGKYIRQKYNLGGVASYNLIKDKLSLGTGIDYLYNTATRSVDPRPSVNTFNLIISPEITYRFNKSAVGLFYKNGYGDEIVNVVYKNDLFTDAGNSDNAYPDRINYLINSFSYDETKQAGSQSRLTRDNRFLGWGAHYNISVNNWSIKNTFSYFLSSEDTRYTSNLQRDSLHVAKFQLENRRFTSLITHTGESSRQLIKLNAQLDYGDDYNYKLGGRNYLYKNNSYSIDYLNLLWKHKKITPEFGLNVTYNSNSKQDFATDHYADYQYLKFGATASIYVINKQNNFSASISPSYRKSLKSFTQPIPADQVTAFTYGVVYPNEYYWAADAAEVSLNFNYISKNLINQFPIGFSLQTNYQQRLNDPDAIAKNINYAGKNRTTIAFAATIYL